MFNVSLYNYYILIMSNALLYNISTNIIMTIVLMIFRFRFLDIMNLSLVLDCQLGHILLLLKL